MLVKSLLAGLWSGLFFGCQVLAAVPNPSPVAHLLPRQTIIPGGKPCGQNNATNRRCWKNNWNITTDYEISTPPAFNTRVYNFDITNVTSWVGPDGVTKHAMLINNQFPGPTIEADWGDYIQVNVRNLLQDNGTSIHWHGIRQLGEAKEDGANGVTECPIAPGKTRSYAFHVMQYGSSWYHSHFSSQYGNGIVGPMVVHGPASADYDIDLGPYMITDYYHRTADDLQRGAELVTGGPPDAQNLLFRGKNINPKASGGSYDRVTLTPGKKHRLRLINTSVDNSFTITMVDHPFLVIQTDLVAIKPVVRNRLFLGVGQRYDVIIEANQTVGHYWLNATLQAQNFCGRTENPFPASIFSYQGATPANGLPTNKGTPITANCNGEVGFEPVVPRIAPQAEFTPTQLNLTLDRPVVDFRGQVFRWQVKDVDIEIEWDHPILEYVYERNNSWPAKANVIEVPQADKWTFWVIQNTFILPHPVHLHGHDFMVLGTGSGTFNQGTATLNFNNPIRRDVEQLPGNGWMVIAFKTDNPGAWLLHCHIAWHVSQGLGVQFLERKSEINALMHLDQMIPGCNEWRAYQPTSHWLPKLDSGLKKKRDSFKPWLESRVEKRKV